jgi:hypothetical protein
MSTIFVKKIRSEKHTDPKLRKRGGGVISMPGKKFWNTVLACTLLRKNFQDGVPLQKYPWV